MTQASFADQVAALNGMLGEIETRVSRGQAPDQSLAEFKGAVDELRLRLWALLGAGSANDYRGFQEQFRLRRALEICRGIEHDLRQGALSPAPRRAGPLGRGGGRAGARGRRRRPQARLGRDRHAHRRGDAERLQHDAVAFGQPHQIGDAAPARRPAPARSAGEWPGIPPTLPGSRPGFPKIEIPFGLHRAAFQREARARWRPPAG